MKPPIYPFIFKESANTRLITSAEATARIYQSGAMIRYGFTQFLNIYIYIYIYIYSCSGDLNRQQAKCLYVQFIKKILHGFNRQTGIILNVL